MRGVTPCNRQRVWHVQPTALLAIPDYFIQRAVRGLSLWPGVSGCDRERQSYYVRSIAQPAAGAMSLSQSLSAALGARVR
jgi:hypothetical protein